MSFKKYMCIDLLMLSVIGIGLEALCTFFVNMTYGACPTAVISFLITYIAIIRWGYKGLIVIPFCALGNLIGGQFIVIDRVQYDWKILLSVILGLSTFSLNLIPYHKWGTNKVVTNNWAYFGMMFLNFIIYEAVRGVAYAYIIQGDNIYLLANAVGYDVTGLAIMLIMGFVLKRQKVSLNFLEKLLAEQEQREKDQQYEEEYRNRQQEELLANKKSEEENEIDDASNQ